jgi:ribosome-associated protein|tara:strand:+ start:943 stop:1320 length:378 start_codon:yes stop_codon:yes gene_type:complete
LSDLNTIKDTVISAIEDIKGFDITVLDVTKLTSMTSYMIVCSANSSRQTKAIANNIYVDVKTKGFEPRGMEGQKEGEWVLVDLDDIIIHIMTPATRTYYNLEQLWGGEGGHISADTASDLDTTAS